VFTPDEITEQCRVKAWRAKPSVVLSRAVYAFNIPSNSALNLSVGADADGYPGTCTWRVEFQSGYIDESVAINHSGAVHCQAPPEFVIENVNVPYYPVDSAPVDCFGTITFTASPEAKVPFEYIWKDQPQYVEGVTCGSCYQLCAVLCVKAGNEYESEYERENFIWNEDDQQWNGRARSGHYITIVEESGKCYLRLDSVSQPTLQGDLIEITECAEGMDLTAVDYDGNYVRISCNPCSCWRHLCGSLRCVCPELCVVGVQDGELIEPFSIEWDYENRRWGDDTFSVTPGRDSYGNCIATVTGYADPVAIDNNGGDEIAFTVSEPLDDQLESGVVNFLSINCKNCAPSCGIGTCLSVCDDVPAVLYAEVSPAPWTDMLGCQPPEGCFSAITIPLVQVFVPTALNPAGEYRWQGCGVIACKNCSSATVTNHLVCIDIGCDGLGTFSVQGPEITVPCFVQFGITIPCNTGDVIDEELDRIDCDGLTLCCDEGGFIVRIME
jgi:hypothetical protein